jgi:GT2 family glycosyltransferase
MPSTSSVLIPSFNRPPALNRCLESLHMQTRPPDEVFVVWQAEDEATRAAAEMWRDRFGGRLQVLHCAECGVVPAENLALDRATGSIILLIDDDAVAPPAWVERHLSFYQDANVGAVGGPARNFHPDGRPFVDHPLEPIGAMNWAGRPIGNMFDQPAAWQSRPPRQVRHLVGYNMSLRRVAFDHFDAGLREYWQLFELEACLQVQRNGYRIMFDFGNVVEHHPTNATYAPGREGNLQIKVYNAAFNHGRIVGLHYSPSKRIIARLWQFWVGSVAMPGLAGAVVSARRYGSPRRELSIRKKCWQAWREGYLDGRQAAHRLAPAKGRTL